MRNDYRICGMTKQARHEYEYGWRRIMQPCPRCKDQQPEMTRIGAKLAGKIRQMYRACCNNCGLKCSMKATIPGAAQTWNSQKWRRVCGDIWADTSIGLALREIQAICGRLDRMQEGVNMIEGEA